MLLKRSVTLQGMAQEGTNEKAFIMYAAHVTSVSNNERSMQKRQLKKLFLNLTLTQTLTQTLTLTLTQTLTLTLTQTLTRTLFLTLTSNPNTRRKWMIWAERMMEALTEDLPCDGKGLRFG